MRKGRRGGERRKEGRVAGREGKKKKKGGWGHRNHI